MELQEALRDPEMSGSEADAIAGQFAEGKDDEQ